MNTTVQASIALGTVSAVLIRLLTGRTPLYWAATLLLVFESLVQQALKSFWAATEHYRAGWRETWRETRASVSRGELAVVKREKVS